MSKGDLSNRERKKESSKHKGDKSIYSSKHIRQTVNNCKLGSETQDRTNGTNGTPKNKQNKKILNGK